MEKAFSMEGTFQPKRRRTFPKKILRHTKIPINEKYTFNVCIWVADTPESNLKPTINLVLQHGYTKLRFCFNEVTEMVEAINQLKGFILDNSFKVHEAYTKALREFIAYHEEKKMTPLNDYTVYTVIQDISEHKYRGKRKFVNTKTGEIIGGKDV